MDDQYSCYVVNLNKKESENIVKCASFEIFIYLEAS